MKSYTQAQVYQLIYIVIKHEYMHLGDDKASRLANKLAVRETWKVFNDPATYIEYAKKLVTLCTPLSTKDIT